MAFIHVIGMYVSLGFAYTRASAANSLAAENASRVITGGDGGSNPPWLLPHGSTCRIISIMENENE